MTFCHENKKHHFVMKARNYGIFVAKIYDLHITNIVINIIGFVTCGFQPMKMESLVNQLFDPKRAFCSWCISTSVVNPYNEVVQTFWW